MKGLTPRPSYGEIVSLAFNLRMKYYRVTIQMKPLQRYFRMGCVVPTFKSMDEVLTCNHSNETFLAERFHGNIFLQGFYREKLQCFCEFLPWSPPYWSRKG